MREDAPGDKGGGCGKGFGGLHREGHGSRTRAEIRRCRKFRARREGAKAGD